MPASVLSACRSSARNESLRFGNTPPFDWGVMRGRLILVRFRRFLIALSSKTAIADCETRGIPKVSPWREVTAQIELLAFSPGLTCSRVDDKVQLGASELCE